MMKTTFNLIISPNGMRYAYRHSYGVELLPYNSKGRAAVTMANQLFEFLSKFGKEYSTLISQIRVVVYFLKSHKISYKVFYATIFRLVGNAFGYYVNEQQYPDDSIVCCLDDSTFYLHISNHLKNSLCHYCPVKVD